MLIYFLGKESDIIQSYTANKTAIGAVGLLSTWHEATATEELDFLVEFNFNYFKCKYKFCLILVLG